MYRNIPRINLSYDGLCFGQHINAINEFLNPLDDMIFEHAFYELMQNIWSKANLCLRKVICERLLNEAAGHASAG